MYICTYIQMSCIPNILIICNIQKYKGSSSLTFRKGEGKNTRKDDIDEERMNKKNDDRKKGCKTQSMDATL